MSQIEKQLRHIDTYGRLEYLKHLKNLIQETKSKVELDRHLKVIQIIQEINLEESN